MTRCAVLLPVLSLLLPGCSSDTALHRAPLDPPAQEGGPLQAPPEATPPGPGPGGPGLPGPGSGPSSPWGELDPGSLPDIYFAVAWSEWDCQDVLDGDGDDWGGCPVWLAVIDLFGQVIAEFPLPDQYETWTPWSYLSLSPAGPGQFLAVLEYWGDVDGAEDDGADADGFWQGRPWEAWRGDAVTGDIEQIARWSWEHGAAQLSSTDRVIDLGGWSGWANLAIPPSMPDWLMLWSGAMDCAPLRELRAVHIPGGNAMDMVWEPEELLPPSMLSAGGDPPMAWPWNLDASVDENGEMSLLLGITNDDCTADGLLQSFELVAWNPDDGPVWQATAAAEIEWPPTASWAGHGGGAALELGGAGPDQSWRVIEQDSVREDAMEVDELIQFRRAGPMLDAEGPSFMTVGRRIDEFDYRDVLEIHHEGSVVWTIDSLRFGLQERSVFIADVVMLPMLPE